MSAKTATLTLETLHLLSDDLALDFNAQLADAIADCRARPGVAKKRTVQLQLVITPHKEDIDAVLITPITTRKTPARELDPIRGRPTPKNQLQFTFDGESGAL
jgi:hypothetical protein